MDIVILSVLTGACVQLLLWLRKRVSMILYELDMLRVEIKKIKREQT